MKKCRTTIKDECQEKDDLISYSDCPIRQFKKINESQNKATTNNNSDRIKSTDYDKWDKYDAGEVISNK